jgi:hypothetical protein
MKDARPGQPFCGDASDTIPRRAILVTAAVKRAPPQIEDVVSERIEAVEVGRNRVVSEVTADHATEPLTLAADRFMPSLPQ